MDEIEDDGPIWASLGAAEAIAANLELIGGFSVGPLPVTIGGNSMPGFTMAGVDDPQIVEKSDV